MRTKIKKVNTGNGYDYCISRDTDGLDFEGTARKSAEQSITSLKKKRIKPGKYTVLFEPHAFADIVKALVIPAVCGVNVQHKASFLDGKMSTRIARDNFTLVDDGTWVKGVNRCHVDHEGTPAQKTALIDRGNLVGLLYDHSSARREEKASTGNGIRFLSPSFDRVYRYTPAVEGTNTIVAGGITSKKDLIEGVNDGILVSFLIGSWSFNFSNGTFSADARNSYRIEKGRITYAIDEATVSGNVTDLIMDIQIGNDTAQSRGCIPLTPAVVATPSVVSNNVIVGA
jgi:TldD protein